MAIKTGKKTDRKRPYVPPKLTEEKTFERDALQGTQKLGQCAVPDGS